MANGHITGTPHEEPLDAQPFFAGRRAFRSAAAEAAMIYDATGGSRRAAWHLTITREESGRPHLVFHAKSLDLDELKACADEARRQRRDLKIMLRAPSGAITEL
jgi:hypothetical protein